MHVQDANDAAAQIQSQAAAEQDGGGFWAAVTNVLEFIFGPEVIDRMQTWDFWLPLIVAVAGFALFLFLARTLIRQYFAEKVRFERKRFRIYYEERGRYEKLRDKAKRKVAKSDSTLSET